MEKQEKGVTGAGVTPIESLQVAATLAEVTLPAATQPKIQMEVLATGDLYRAEEELRRQGSVQGLGMEFPLTSTQESVAFTSHWRARGLLELDESREWRYLTAFHGQTVENL